MNVQNKWFIMAVQYVFWAFWPKNMSDLPQAKLPPWKTGECKVKGVLMKHVCVILTCIGFTFFPGLAEAVESPGSKLDAVGEVLLVFLVLSVAFEVALTPVFNSRLYLARFEGKGVKVPLTIVLALIVFWGYELDIIQELLNALGHTTTDGQPISLSFGGQLLTAFLIAGGSDGTFRIFSKLGIRNPKERKEKAALEKASMAEKAQVEKTEAEKSAVQKEHILNNIQREKQEAEKEIEAAKAKGDDSAQNKAIELRDAKEKELNQVKAEKARVDRILAMKTSKANKALAEQISAQKEAGLGS